MFRVLNILYYILLLLLCLNYKILNTLHLNEEEKHNLYTAAGAQKKTIPLDLPEYIMEHEYVSAALRTARDLEAGEEEWQKFIEDLKRRRG